MTELQVRHGRTGIGVPLAGLSLFIGLFGALGGRGARSGAVESSFSDVWSIGWYSALALGGLLLLAALARPWPPELTVVAARCMVNRLYLERAGLFIVGWMWQSYAFAALGIQGTGGATAASLATVIGLYTWARIRAQFRDLRPLRAWLADATSARAAVPEERSDA